MLDKNGIPKMVDDIDVRFGDNAVPSGYEDVQMRFEKNGNLYELLILPGPNYLAIKNKEHELVYENFRKYDTFVKDDGAKQIIKAIKKEYHKLTKGLYADAKHRDASGAKKSEQITFTREGVESVDKLFKSLKTLFLVNLMLNRRASVQNQTLNKQKLIKILIWLNKIYVKFRFV
ncbi:MAG: hypothetical protein ACLSA2_06490 [Candidatus Gastranaerophilaceae bacterium]